MQFNRDASGKLNALPKPSVDTGMGLERMASVLQNKISVFDTDLFTPLIREAAWLCHKELIEFKNDNSSLRIIADHSRAATFLISDGVIPSNEGRGYVLRRIIRRALRHGNKLGLNEPFFFKLVKPLVKEMGEAYIELQKAQSHIEKILHQEEEQFSLTLSQG